MFQTTTMNLISYFNLHSNIYTYKDVWCCSYIYCHNPNLGLVIEASGCKVAGQEKDPGVASHALGSAKSARE
jgi:hypothetical protein